MFGISSQAVAKWDRGASIPFDKIPVLVAKGFDAQYILTGVRSTNLNQVHEKSAPYDNSLDARLARLSETQQDVVKMMIEELERAAEREKTAKLAAAVVINGKK